MKNFREFIGYREQIDLPCCMTCDFHYTDYRYSDDAPLMCKLQPRQDRGLYLFEEVSPIGLCEEYKHL